jgi:Ni,Fe-hydrogenase III small subunit/NAD-dependent dihydropyrimidine dehydrogenase PreA subunit
MKAPIRKAIGNIFSTGMTQSVRQLFETRSKMPFAGDGCEDCGKCVNACPANALRIEEKWTIDIGRCILCGDCLTACKNNAISLTDAPDYAFTRDALVFTRGDMIQLDPGTVDEKRRKLLKGSISIREVDTGSCNACEVEVNMLTNPYYDMERFGLRITASPRHADMLLVTGPVTENMRSALLMAVEATPEPKVIVAMGSCAISGGLFTEGRVTGEGVKDTVAVDLFIPGCPPKPARILRTILSAFGRRPR